VDRILVVDQSQRVLGRLEEGNLVAGKVGSPEVESLEGLHIQLEKAAAEQASPRGAQVMAEREVAGVAAVEEVQLGSCHLAYLVVRS
jgi:hypothetical protein